MRKTLCQLRQTAEGALNQTSIGKQFSGDLEMIVITRLAEGADRLIGRTAIDLNYRLGAILPFSISDYEATFDLGENRAAVNEFRALLGAAALPLGHGVIVFDGNTTQGGSRDAAFAMLRQYHHPLV